MSPDPNKQLHEGFKSWFTGKKPESPDPGNPFLAVTTEPFRGIDYEDVVEHFFPNADEKFRKKFTGALGLIKLLDKPFVKRFVEDMGPGIEKGGYRYKTIVYFLNRLMEKGKDLYSKPENYKDNPIIMKGLQDPDSDIFKFLEMFKWMGEKLPDPGTEAGGEAGADAPPTGADAGEQGGGAGAEFAAPVFKKYSGKEQEAGAPQRSLASQLMKLFPDVEKSALTMILKDVAAQLKANNIEIQENKEIFVKNLIMELLEEGTLPGNRRQLKKQAKILDLKPGDYKKHPKLRGFYAMNDEGATRRYDSEKEAQDWAGVKNVDDPDVQADIEVDDSDIMATYDEPGPKEPAPNAKPGSAYAMLYKKFNEVIKILDVAEPAGLEGAMKVDQSFLGVYKLYKAMKYTQKFLKNPETADSLDDNQADRIVKMLPIMKKMRPLNEEQWMYNIDDTDPKKDLLTLLRDFIGIFERFGVDNRERAIKAMRDARGASDRDITEPQTRSDGTKETPEEVVTRVTQSMKKGDASQQDLIKAQEKAKASGAEAARGTGKAGTVNVRQSVGPRLKGSGIDLKSPEGKALQKKMLKVIRRFLGKNLKRMGKDVAVVSENVGLQRRILSNLREILVVKGLVRK